MRVFSKQFSIKMKYEDGMLILGQNDIFCGHNIVIFQCDFYNWQQGFFKYLAARHVTEPGSLLTEPVAVIKSSHLSIHHRTCML